jgi:hypothetical protein
MYRIAQVAVPVFGKHAQACFMMAFTAYQHFTQHRAIIARAIGHLPV